MHESSLIGSLMIKIEEIARDAGAERVTRVHGADRRPGRDLAGSLP